MQALFQNVINVTFITPEPVGKCIVKIETGRGILTVSVGLQHNQSLKDTFTVEMSNGKLENTNNIYIECTITLNNYSFQIDLMSVTIKSFDIIIGMDWLSPHHADILCYEKAILLNLPSSETLCSTWFLVCILDY